MQEPYRSMNTQVLVIGAGAAGCRAALEAAKQGADVIVCAKGKIGVSGATCFSGAAFAGFNAADDSPGNTKLAYYNDIMNAGAGVCDEQLVRLLADEAIAERDFLEHKGVPFARSDSNNEYVLNKGCFSTISRAYMIPGHGHAIVKMLQDELKEWPVKQLEDTIVTKLIVENGRVQGAVALGANGEPIIIRSGAVILAAGGSSRLFRHNMNPPDVTGDGYALAYRAGATLTNMEFVQFGLATVYPDIFMVAYWLFNVQPMLRNAKGEAILTKYLPAGVTADMAIADKAKHFPFTSSDNSKYVDIAIKNEITAGGAGANGGVFLDFRNLDESILAQKPDYVQQMWKKEKAWLMSRNVDVNCQPLEIASFAQAINGGALIDENGQTNIKGLFACGENAAGPHGADRLGGNMLVASQVFAHRAGRAAAFLAKAGLGGIGFDMAAAEAEIKRIMSMKNDLHNGLTPDDMVAAIQDYMDKNMAVVRSQESITACLQGLDDIESKLPQMGITTADDVIKATEISNMVLVGKIMCQAALCRRESRGSHYRMDYPQRNDDDFKKNIFISDRGGKQCVKAMTIRDYRLESPSIQL